MQFDQNSYNTTTHEAIKAKYKAAGYKMPAVIYWNINASSNNVPTLCNAPNVALVSGYSPSDVKGIVESKVITPYDVMMSNIMSNRYDIVIKSLGLEE